MITEQDIRGIYNGYYKIAETLGKGITTQELSEKLRLIMTSFFPMSRKVVSDDSKELFRIIENLDKEYQPKFYVLELKQGRLEAQTIK